MKTMDVFKEIKGIQSRLAVLEAHALHSPKKPVAKKKGKQEDNLLKRERLEKAPKFSDAELWDHNVKHKAGVLPEHKHKPSTTKQFQDFVRRGAEKKDKADAKRIKADRAAISKQKQGIEAFKKVLDTCPPEGVMTELHRVTRSKPSLPYVYVMWQPPKASKFKIKGYYVEVNGSTWKLQPPDRPMRRLMKAYSKGSKVRVGVLYGYGRHEGISWSCYKYRR